MKKFISLLISSIACLSLGSLAACGDRTQMEAYTLKRSILQSFWHFSRFCPLKL